MGKALVQYLGRPVLVLVVVVVLIAIFHTLLWHGPHLYYVLQGRRGAKLCQSIKPGIGRSQALRKLHAVQPYFEGESAMGLYLEWRDAGCRVNFDSAGTVSKVELQQVEPISFMAGGPPK